MAIGDPYASLTELKDRLRTINDTNDDANLTRALAVASLGIEGVCRRQFNQDSSATARLYRPRRRDLVTVDDFFTTAGLLVATDEDGDGTYETTWSTSDYQLEPLNGVVNGQSGWPFWKVRAVDIQCFPVHRWQRRASLQVTAQWGWDAVPTAVKEACLVVAEETFALKDAKFGVASTAEWGVFRVKANPMAMAMLEPYRLDPVLVA